MAIFEEIRLAWKGRERKIPPDRVLPAIARVEEVVTLGELGLMLSTSTFKFAKLAAAYGVLLRYAGEPVSDDEVYESLLGAPGNEQQQQVLAAVNTMIRLMLPPAQLRVDDKAKKPAATG